MVFDSTRLRSYSNAELVALLSQESLERNISGSQGLVNLGATSPSPPAGPVTAAARDSEHRAFSLSITPASSLPYPEAVVEELVRRQPTAELLRAFNDPADLVQLSWLEATFERIRTPAVDSGLTLIAGQPDTLDPNFIREPTYYALKYFARDGKPWALRILSCEYTRWPVSSMERAEVVPLFGEYKYYPAAPNLAETIDAMFLNLGDAAMTALKQMFPEGRTDFRSPMEAADYWRQYIGSHYKGPRDDAQHCRAERPN